MNILDLFDLQFSMRLEQWSRLRGGYHSFFSPHEVDSLERAERTFNTGSRTVVLLAFENRFVSLGGLAPVMKYLPQKLRELGERVIVVTPFHAEHSAMKGALKAGLFETCFSGESFQLCDYEATLSCYRDTSAEIPAYYLSIPGRFGAGENPYSYPDKNELLLDTLAFASAVPVAMSNLGVTRNILFHAHEWEAAPIAVTSKMAVISGILHQARTVLTLHNSFDAPFPAEIQRRFFAKATDADTVLQCSLPLLNGPLIAVSTPFARELTCDPLQRTVFADHLQKQFAMNPPLGIENGIFGEDRHPFTPRTLALAEAGDFEKTIIRKNTYKRRFLKALKQTRDPRIIGKITVPADDTDLPIFFLAGRLDFMQKGFDVMLQAFTRLKRGRAKLFFCPSSMDANSTEAFAFFKEITERCAGDIEIWPFKIQRRVYDLFLKGASYLIMPSIYEPFGSANEGLLSATPVLARGTGGLWVQVNSATPVKVPGFYGNLCLDNTNAPSTGIIYREECSDAEAEVEWRKLLELPVSERPHLPLYESLVKAAYGGLKNAISLYGRPQKYAPILINSIKEARKFSWDRAAKKYRQVYDVATNRG